MFGIKYSTPLVFKENIFALSETYSVYITGLD